VGTLKGVSEDPQYHSAITDPIELHELLKRIDRSLRGQMVAINSRFVRSIRGAYRENSIGSWDRRAPRRRSSSYHLRRSARVSIVSCGTTMNATKTPISPQYKLVFSNAARLAAILCVLPGFAMYPAALRAQEVRTITPQAEAAIAARPETPAAGGKDGDVTIIEFFSTTTVRSARRPRLSCRSYFVPTQGFEFSTKSGRSLGPYRSTRPDRLSRQTGRGNFW